MAVKIILIIVSALCFPPAQAQLNINETGIPDSIWRQIIFLPVDTEKLKFLIHHSDICEPEDILRYTQPAIALAKINLALSPDEKSKTLFTREMANAYNNNGYFYKYRGDSLQSKENYFLALKLQKSQNDLQGIATTLNNIGALYSDLNNTPLAISFIRESGKIYELI